jgi:hypothetical protein
VIIPIGGVSTAKSTGGLGITGVPVTKRPSPRAVSLLIASNRLGVRLSKTSCSKRFGWKLEDGFR